LPDWIGQRLEREIRSITEYGYADLYFIAHKLVKFSHDHGYIVGSRGSVGSSLVAHLADITEVNPLAPHYRCPEPSCKLVIQGDTSLYGCGADMPDQICPNCGTAMHKEGFDIPFEVFLGFEGDKAPDIDLNFSSGEHQTQAQKYTEELFGKDNIFKAGTITTVAEKTAFGFVRNYYKEKGVAVRDIEAERLVGSLTGVRRTTGQHPGGIVVLPKGDDILNYTPVQRPADALDSEFITTHFDYHAIDSCLVKLDILGHDDPAMIRSLANMTGKDIREISLDDQKVMSLFCGPQALELDPAQCGIETGTLGVPEFGTNFVRGMLLDIKPSTFSDLIRISGFSHGTDVWLNNTRDILKENLGTMQDVIGCRDDIMLTLIRDGVNSSHAFRIMEQVRKGNGLKREDIEAMEEAEVPTWYIASCQKIKYLFPKAHAVAYVTMAFRIAWFKVFEPLAFYAATFSVREGLDGAVAAGGIRAVESAMAEIRSKRERREATGTDEDRYVSLELAREMLLRGFDFAPVNLEKSGADMYLPENGKLRLPFTSLSGFGLPTSQSIVAGREEKPYRSIEDLSRRGKVGKSLIAMLKVHGALGSLPESDQQTMF
jgi:DNA polymerase-3 subunit alpha (Gram-positive type)